MAFFKNNKAAFIQIGVWLLLWILVLIIGSLSGMNVSFIFDYSVHWVTMFLLFALAMITTIKVDAGPNLALPIGVICGSLDMVCALQFNFEGFLWLMMSLVMAISLAVIVGFSYGLLLKKMKGSVGTSMILNYILGIAAAGVFGLLCVILPFNNPYIMYAYGGEGLRPQVGLGLTGSILDNFLAIHVGPVVSIPLGLILILAAICALFWYFFWRKDFTAYNQVGLAAATTLNKDKDCIIAGIVSTVLGAVGAIFYAQSYGFVQLYNSVTNYTVFILAAIFLGGVTVKKAGMRQAITGMLLYSGWLALRRAIDGFFNEDFFSDIWSIVTYGIIIFVLIKEVWRRKADKKPELEISPAEAPVHNDSLVDSRELPLQ
jgi:simple sugar transport system permease protein